jgi:RNA polymerase sigma factor (TIGR02999 family)
MLHGPPPETSRFWRGKLANMNDVTRILSAIDQGDPHAAEKLLPLVYDALRKLAAQKMAQEKPGQTLDATALVHEAYVRLVGTNPEQSWDNRGHFFAAAAEAMRRILIDSARRKKRDRHGGGQQRVELSDELPAPDATVEQLLAVDEALSKLASQDPAAANLVKLHYFAGMSIEDAAQALGQSRAGAYRHWTFARAWLLHEIRQDHGS